MVKIPAPPLTPAGQASTKSAYGFTGGEVGRSMRSRARATPVTASDPRPRTSPGLPWRLARAASVLAIAVVPHVVVQRATPGLVDADGYYHIRYAELLRHALPHLRFPFPWLPETILDPAEFTDHHLLFHLALVPFTFGDLVIGAKAAAIVFAAAATLCWFLVARAERVAAPVLWLLGLVGSSPGFLYRLAMPRRQSLTLAVMLVTVHCVLARRPAALVALGFAFAWLYDGWPLLLLLAGIALAARAVEDGRLEPRLALATPLGLVLGSVIHPDFPRNVVFGLRHVLPKLGLAPAIEGTVGNEWYPYSGTALVATADIALALPLLGLCLALAAGRGRRSDARLLAWGGCTAVYVVLVLVSRRFLEHEPAFATLFAAAAWTAFVATPRGARLVERLAAGLRPAWLPAAAVLLVVAGATVRTAGALAARAVPPTLFADAAGWLAQNAPARERVFNTDWDAFPLLFYRDRAHAYVVGLDPTYLSQHDAELYRRWYAIGMGLVERPGAEIQERFGARWVFATRARRTFIERAATDPRLRAVFRDDEAVVFEVLPP